MTIKEKRPFPVPSEVVMRSALFALANLNAKLQVYNEETGVIVATVTKWLGMQKQEVIVKVRRFEETCDPGSRSARCAEGAGNSFADFSLCD